MAWSPAEAMLKDICGSDLFQDVAKIMSYDLFNDERFEKAIKIVKDISEDVIVPVAIMLICIYFLLNVIDKMTSENFTWEQLARVMVMLIVGKFLIENSFEILSLLFELGTEIVNQVKDLGTGGLPAENSDLAVEMFRQTKEKSNAFMKVVWEVVMMFVFVIPWFVSWAMRLCVRIICYSRMIEILLRAAFAPVALSDFFQNGLQGSGWRFLKNFLAVSLQGVLIVAISLIYNALMGAILTADVFEAENLIDWTGGTLSFIGIWLAASASAIMLMFRSLSLSKEILGTGN